MSLKRDRIRATNKGARMSVKGHDDPGASERAMPRNRALIHLFARTSLRNGLW